MIATAAWLRGDRRIVVVCPPQVVAEWKIQLAEVFGDVRCLTVHKPAQLAAVPDVPEVAGYVQCVFVPTSMLSWERRRGLGGTGPGRLPGSDGERERTARNSRAARPAGPVPREPGHPFWVRFGDEDGDGDEAEEAAAEAIEAARVRAGEEPGSPAVVWHRYMALRDRAEENRRRATPIVRGVACPRCGEICTPHLDPEAYAKRTGDLLRCRAVLEDDSVCGEPLWQYAGNGRPRRPVRVCSACGWHRLDSSGRPLSARAAARGRCEACLADCSAEGAIGERLTDLRGGSIAAAWKRIGFSADLLVLDEVHQFKGSGTQRGAEAGRLIGLAKAVALATGTLTNGQSSSLYHVLCRIAPALRKRFRTAAAFARSYGVSERSYDVVQRRPADRVAVRGLRSVERPGLHPLVLSELLGFSSFLSQSDVLDREIEVEEFLEAVPMPDLPSPPISAQEHPEQWREWIEGPVAHALKLVRDGDYGDAAEAEWERFVAASEQPPGEREDAAEPRLFLQDSPAERYAAVRRLILGEAREDGDGDGDGGDADGAPGGGRAARRRTESMLGVMRMLPDTWHWRGEAVGNEFGHPRAVVPPSPRGSVSPKEERLIEICRGEAAAGRRCLVYVDGMDIRDVAGRLERKLREAGLNAVALRSRAHAAADRKSWFEARVAEGIDVVIAHPGAAGTGLNLQALPTVIAYEYTLSAVAMRQAMWRPLRVDQRDLVRMVFMCAKDTAQEAELVLYMSSLLASAPVEGRTITPDRLARRIGRTEIAAQARGYDIMDVMLGEGGALREDLAAALGAAAEDSRWFPLPPLPCGGGRGAGERPRPIAPGPGAGFEDVREDDPAAGGGFEARQLSLFAA